MAAIASTLFVGGAFLYTSREYLYDKISRAALSMILSPKGNTE